MFKNRLALWLVAAVPVLVAVSVIGWAMSRPDDGVEREPAELLSWDSEPTAAPLEIGDARLAAELLVPSEEPIPAALEPEPLVEESVWDDSNELLLAAGESELPSNEVEVNLVESVTSVESEPTETPEAEEPVLWADGAASKSLRNRDFPNTYISRIDVDLTSPNHWVRLTWTGPQAGRQETGPFHSSPGAGLGNNNCNEMSESNRDGSNCTPKGEFAVEAFSDHMRTYRQCRFVTWFHVPRAIAFHSYWDVPNYPASHGCVRLDVHAAQLIHNNSLMGKTKVTVGGTWTRR